MKDVGWVSKFNQDKLKNTKLKFDLINADDGNVVATPEDKLTPRFLKKLEESGLKNILVKVRSTGKLLRAKINLQKENLHHL